MTKKATREMAAMVLDDFQHDAIVLRSCNQDGSSRGGFLWPTVAGGIVTAPDWNFEPVCGGGLHGLLAGLGDWSLMDEVVVIDEQKVKFPRCRVLYVGHFGGAMDVVSPAMTDEILRIVAERTRAAKVEAGGRSRKDGGAATASGDQGAATASGDRGAATASGDRGAATASGYRGAATASGYQGAATASGDRGAATASGKHGVAIGAGPLAIGMVTESNLLVLIERESSGAILNHFAAMCGTNGVEAGVYYRLTDGKLERVS